MQKRRPIMTQSPLRHPADRRASSPPESTVHPPKDPPPDDEPEVVSSFSVLFAKVFWAILGPMVLGGIVISIAMRPTGWLSWIDAVFAAVLLLVLVARTVDQRAGTAMRADGRRATPRDFRRFCVFLTASAAVAWIGAHLIGG
jgi:hypothetical protein